ncbi:hypothetical protein Cfor_04102 [Coptotermes formosanus]|uniref:Ionotropic glutamate receptor L-glutamate and glycine-binding domain-containing protein n=1 Tax=Coptotermes formosanus TaxID=36987 RepID=A0A6L2PK29_COPFO|nr:hypothetical protein Cfor_04102 [Coptotermes formosanus]
MQLTRLMIFLEYLGILQLTFSMNKPELLAEEQRHIVLCVSNIVHQHLLPRQSLLVSTSSVRHNATTPTPTHTHLHEDDFDMVDTFLRNLSDSGRWSVEVSRLGAPEPEILNENFLKHDTYIIFTGIQKKQSDIIRSVSEQLYKLQKSGSWNYRARFVVLTSVHITVSTQELAFKIFEEMWEFYSVMNVLLVISVSNFKFNDIVMETTTPKESTPEIELQLFSWFPYTSPIHCDKLNEAVLLDRWNSNGQFVLKANLFPEKVPKTFHRCSTKVISFIYPPVVMETSDKNYTGLEVRFIEVIFKKLNLTAKYVISPFKRDNFYQKASDTILQIEPASSDIAIGVLPFDASQSDIAEATIPYLHIKVACNRRICATETHLNPPYDIIKKNRKECKTIYACLRRVIEHKDFATILDNFHAEYFKTRLLFHNIHVPVCTLQEDVMIYRVSTYMAKGHPLLHRFNKIITHMFEAGLHEKWQNDFMSSTRLYDRRLDDDDTNLSDFATNKLNTDYSPYSLIRLKVVFHTLLIGHVCSTLVFLAEVLHYTACFTEAPSISLYNLQGHQHIRTKSL